MRLVIAVVLLCCAVFGQAPGAFEVKITVVNSLTGAPMPGANVIVQPDAGERLLGRTNESGVFAGRVSSGGRSLLMVARPGFHMTGPGIMGARLELKAGLSEATVRMEPLGVLAGRVVDQYGDPIRNALVCAFQTGNHGSSSRDRTNDLGEFRIAGIEPGFYYAAVEARSGSRNDRVGLRESAGLNVFPNTLDLSQARQVEIAAGQTTRIEDLSVTLRPQVTLRGRVVGIRGDKPNISISRAGPHIPLDLYAINWAGTPDANGEFELKAFAGRYRIEALDQSSGRHSQVEVVVNDKDISGLELTLQNGFEISGRVIVDGPERVDFSQVHLACGPRDVEIGPDGRFQLKSSQSQLPFLLHELPAGFYLKDVRVNGRTVRGRLLNLQQAQTEISILLGARAGELVVQIEDGVMGFAFLLPEGEVSEDPETVIHSVPEKPGSAVIRGIPPGKYRLFAFDMMTSMLVLRPDLLMEKFGKQAPLITIAEGDRKTIALPLMKP